jgi:hypothetical protein
MCAFAAHTGTGGTGAAVIRVDGKGTGGIGAYIKKKRDLVCQILAISRPK